MNETTFAWAVAIIIVALFFLLVEAKLSRNYLHAIAEHQGAIVKEASDE